MQASAGFPSTFFKVRALHRAWMFLTLLFIAICNVAALRISMQEATVFVNVSATVTWTRMPGDPTRFLVHNRLEHTIFDNLPELPAVNVTDDVLQGTLDLVSDRAGLHRLEAWDAKNISNVFAFSSFNVLLGPPGDNVTNSTGSSAPKTSQCSSCTGPSVSMKTSGSSIKPAALAGGIVGGFVILCAAIIATWIVCCRVKGRHLQWVDAQYATKEVADPFDPPSRSAVTEANHRRILNDERASFGYTGDHISSPTSTGSDNELIMRIQELRRLTAQLAAVPVSNGEQEHADTPPSYAKRRVAPPV